MARPLREDYEGAWHHVMNRGQGRKLIFRDSDDVVCFLDTIGDMVERFGVEIHAYSMMPNHFHLLVRSLLGNLSEAMKHLGATYTQLFNRRYHCDGSLFRGRFKSQLVRHDAYLMYLLAYIHLNPLRAGLITRLDGLQAFTGHRRYMGKDAHPEWLSCDYFLSQFETAQEMKDLILKLHQKALPWPEGMNLEEGWFDWNRCAVSLKQPSVTEEKPRIKIEELLDDLCHITGVDLQRLRQGIKGSIGNPERRFAVRALTLGTYLSHREIGNHLGMTTQHVAREIRREPAGIQRYNEWMKRWRDKHPNKLSVV